MTVYLLSPDSHGFPDPEYAESDGLLAVGGDLSVERLITAYSRGIFPWYGPGTPILWWCPDPRLVLFPQDLHISKSLRKSIRKNQFDITFNKAFPSVIRHCAGVMRPDGHGTWLVPDMIEAYETMHHIGMAHSVEAWLNGVLVGGLYGVSVGKAFFGESMFFYVNDASKTAFVYLVRRLANRGFDFIDCQQTTKHLQRFGAVEIPRPEFLQRLRTAAEKERDEADWLLPDGFDPLSM